jgi:hypothetical protein
MRRNLLSTALLTALLLPTIALAQVKVVITPEERKMAERITASQLKDYLYFIAADEMEGRDAPSRGLDITANFLAMMSSRLGLKPAGDNGTYFQNIDVRVDTPDGENSKLAVIGKQFKYGDDFLRVTGTGDAGNRPLVYGGAGWYVKSKGIDDFKGIDVKGKILVLSARGVPNMNNLTQRPAGVVPGDLQGERGVDWADPLTNATRNGAAGIIIVANEQIMGSWNQVRNAFGRTTLYWEKLRPDTARTSLPVLLASANVGAELMNGMAAGNAVELKHNASMAAAIKSERKVTRNVIALWEGRDPILKKEMVSIGSHYDHVGVNPNAPGDDKIWNGADDDGSGTVGMLAIAEALSKAPVRPKRSVLFVWHTAEEKGLIGSEYFNKFPTVDISKVIANLNIDMIGRSKKEGDTDPRNKDLSGPNGTYLIGAELMSTTLGAVTLGTNNAYLKLDYDRKYDDPADTNRFFFRSDHFHYAVNGIPAVFWFTGVHEDYHQPGDHPDKIDYVKMEKISRTIFLTLWELTDLKERPKVDKQLPPELTRR